MEQGLPADFGKGGQQYTQRARPGILVAAPLLLLVVLAVPVFRMLGSAWTGDYRFSHGPLALAGTAYLLWRSRCVLWQRGAPDPAARWLLGLGSLAAVGGLALDAPTVLPPAWLMLLLGALGVLRGKRALRVAAPALGLLLFALPWPTPVLKGVTSAAQAIALHLTPRLAPGVGMSVERYGWTLATAFEGGAGPYRVIVGPGCAGMKYLLALLALAYFAAVTRRMRWPESLALLAVAVPLALIANSLRILLILGFGAAYGARAGEWAHQNLGLVAFWLPCVVLAAGRRWAFDAKR